MIAAVTIRGCVTARKTIVTGLEILKMKRKFSMRVLENNNQNLSMLNKVRNRVMFGEISKEMKEEILKKFGEKRVYNLHPPRGGFKKSIKQTYPAGETGKRSKEDMENYLRRMMV